MDPVLIPIVALLIPIVIVPTSLAFRHARYLREVEHAERMRAMELGRSLAEDDGWSPSRLAGGIGIGVPLGALFLARVAESLSGGVAWPTSAAAGVIGLGGLICGTFLATRAVASRDRSALADHDAIKPEYDPDAFDVVGRRG